MIKIQFISRQYMDHPIKTFINDLFGDSQPDERQNKWAQILIDGDYESVQDLKEIPDDVWSVISKNIPFKIIGKIRKKLIGQDQNQNTSLSSQDKQQLCDLLNADVPHTTIVSFLGAQLGTPRGDSILARIKSLMKPPKPYPDHRKKVSAKTNGNSLPLFLYKGEKRAGTRYYTFLVVGQTGSGKTTLLDAFVNKLTGMEMTDNWRWKLVDEDHLPQTTKFKSQTTNINVYYINDLQDKFNICIIDSPGFGDTGGIQVDDKITEKFEAFFNQISEIDFILLTVKSSQTRLGPTSKYIYTRVQQIFGNDAKDKFIVMCTFADGKNPACLDPLKGNNIIYEKYFKFNNSALYTPSEQADPTTKFFWKMAVDSVQQFEDYVINRNCLPLSLKLSKQVLQARKYLELSIKTSQKSFTDTLKQLDIAKANLKCFKQNKKQIEENGTYTKLQSDVKLTQKKLNDTYQVCQRCNVTCCQVCKWPKINGKFADQSACTYFNMSQYNYKCPKCPGKCPKSAHIRSDDLIIRQNFTKTVVIKTKKDAFDQGTKGAALYRSLLAQEANKIKKLVQQIWFHASEIKTNIKKLQQKALIKKHFSDQDFYEQLIKIEEQKREDGYIQRVKHIREVLERIQICKSVSQATNPFQLFPELEQLQREFNGNQQQSRSTCEIY